MSLKPTDKILRDIFYWLVGSTPPDNSGTTGFRDEFDAVLTPGAGLSVKDTSLFSIETTALLGGSATFTGPLRDAANYNWFGAKANISGGQAGTLFIDESSATSGANIYQVATQAVAAEPATHGSPGTVAATTFGARIAPTKTVLRFLRAVFVNGAGAQSGAFEVQSALSPLN